MNVAVFASGGGSNFQALIDKVGSGECHCTLALCVGNNGKAGAFSRATQHGIPVCHIAPSHFATTEAYEDSLLDALAGRSIDLIALAGYMKKIPARVIAAYADRIVNIHPALLPAFGGKGLFGHRVHQAVLDYGAKLSGVTIHFVDEEYDHGPIIYQASVPVLDTDDAHALAQRVLALEHQSYWKVLDAIALGRVVVKGRKTYGEI